MKKILQLLQPAVFREAPQAMQRPRAKADVVGALLAERKESR